MRIVFVAAICAVLLAAAPLALAQEPLLPESLVPREAEPFGVLDRGESSPLLGAPENQQEIWAVDLVSGLSLTRSTSVKRIDRFGWGEKDLPFFYLFSREQADDLSAALTGTTRFTYTRKLNENLDVFRRRLGYTEYRAWGIEQLLGGGSTALTLGFRKGRRESANAGSGQVRRVSEEQYSLKGGLGPVGQLSLGFSRSQVEARGGPVTRALQAALSRSLSGGQGKFSFSRTVTSSATSEVAQHKADVVLPLAVRGGTAKAEYHRQAKVVNGVETSSRKTLFTMPLALWSKDARFTWQLVGNVKKGVATEQRLLTLALPIRLFDHSLGNTFTDQRVTTKGGITRKREWVWTIPFEKKSIRLGYSRIQPYSPAGEPGKRQRIETVQVPQLPIFTDRLHVGFSQTRTETVGGSTVRVTKWNADASPFDRLSVLSQVQEKDQGPGTATRSMQLKSDLALAPNLKLNWRYLETQQVGMSPSIERFVGAEHKLDRFPLRVRIGYTSYETPEGQEPRESAFGAQLAVGKPDKTSLTATYMQFEEKHLKPLPEEAIDLALTHHVGKKFAVRAQYLDTPGRIEPMRGVTISTSLFGATATLGLKTNPPDPRNPKKVRHADQWDAELKRKVGSLDLAVSYRYCEYERDLDQVEQYVKLALSGGKPEAGGQLTVAYGSGDFAPAPPKKGAPLPGSTLELRYRKRWSSAELALSLRRTTAPWGQFEPEGYSEGRLELKALW